MPGRVCLDGELTELVDWTGSETERELFRVIGTHRARWACQDFQKISIGAIFMTTKSWQVGMLDSWVFLQGTYSDSIRQSSGSLHTLR